MLCLGRCFAAAAAALLADKSIGIEYCQKIAEKVLPIPISILQTKSIGDSIGSDTNTAILTTLVICSYDNNSSHCFDSQCNSFTVNWSACVQECYGCVWY